MRIVTQLQLDTNQNPYWTAKLVEGNNVVIEVQSKTFNPNNQHETRVQWEEVNGTMLTHILKEKDRAVVVKMLLNDDKNVFENKPKDR